MPFDMSFVYDFQNAVFQMEKLAVGLFALVVLASLARMVLWALLTPVCGKFAGLVSNVCMWVFAAMLFARPDLVMAAVNYSYVVASQFIGGAGGLPGVFDAGGLENMVNDAVNQIRGAFPF
ncbi:MAG: hypothetical protein IMW94_04300 [Thermoanaerobacter sp.]|nr:hypothetical protein [Thermoanaerobacter sp.]